jgi:hypothetical protein
MRAKLIVGVCLGLGGAFAGCAASENSKEPLGEAKLATLPCDLSAPFMAPERLMPEPPPDGGTFPFSTFDFDGLTFSANGDKMYLSSPHIVGTSYDIMRSDIDAGIYEDPDVVNSLNTMNNDDRAPFLRADGNTLYMHRVDAGYNDIFYSTLDGGSEFVSPAPLSTVNTPLHDQDPFYLETNNTLFFASERGGSTVKDIYYLSGGTVYQLPTGNNAVNRADADDYRPVLTSDGLTLYFASKRSGIGGDTDGDIWMATRASLSDPFGTPTRLDILNRSGRDFPVAISPDNCTLYIATNQDTGLGGTDHYRLYKAKRMETTPANVTLTLQIYGTGSVTTSPFNCSNTGASWGGTGTCSASMAPGTVQQIDASSSSTWSGSCTGYTSPDSNGLAIWAEGGTCRITIQ